jgi:hypothetical protein
MAIEKQLKTISDGGKCYGENKTGERGGEIFLFFLSSYHYDLSIK